MEIIMGTVGILTGGGDCPGLNAVIGAVVRMMNRAGKNVIGFLDGWKGIIDGKYVDLSVENTSEIVPLGGTIIGTSRTNPYKKEKENIPRIKKVWQDTGLEALVAVGGDDTLSVAQRLWSEEGLNIVAVPKTIDNDISATDFTFGFDTAVNNAVEAIDKVRTTADSHHRVFVVEVMGRHAGWIATYAGMAAGADAILIPEKEIDMDEVCDILKRNREHSHHNYNIVVAAEGAVFKKGDYITHQPELDEFGNVHLGGIAEQLSRVIEKRTGFETRTLVLGHLQRGGTPSAFDRVLGIRYGARAAQLVLDGEFGKMVALRGVKIEVVDIAEAVAKTKTVDMDLYRTAEDFFHP
jgi:phosphofructokinase-like protein